MSIFYINYKISEEQIIDEKTLIDADNGKNYLNPNDFMFLCEGETLEDAQQYYRSCCHYANCERFHP